ncbi:acetyltransferase [Paenibacillus pectinilyticus]|uniref:Acetyltransferase n=1 Tax=Paenibacillus pectinilyticus TaxID=512399 RepID=A0A1C0ZW22_9BACL|nr:DapH/DapD/GlmU-related protein [Paenibacillus pectinilyticus]OCT12238.1 acetyltransferase [Paenibacillus pectinilyticus]
MKSIHQTHPHLPLSAEPRIHESSLIFNSFAGEWTSIGPTNRMLESSIGDYSYTMDDVTINYAEIGKFTSIASHVCINPVDHPMDRVSQHHMTYRISEYGFADTDDAEFFDWRRGNRVTIGHDVWIGHGAIVMKGVQIGTGAVVGSGAVVTKDVEPYTIVVGVAARPIKARFPKEICEALLQIAWWDWPREWLEERFHELNDVNAFVKKYG